MNNSIRQHYITLSARGNVVITYRVVNNCIEVTFEQAVNGGFNTMVTDIDGNIKSNEKFSSSDTAYLQNFLAQNKECLIGLVKDNA